MFISACNMLQFPAEATQALQNAHSVLEKEADFTEACGRFVTEGSENPGSLLSALAEKTGIPYTTVTMVCLIHTIPRLQALYAAKGIDEAILLDTLSDLRCKLLENHAVSGIWGTDAVSWYQRIFTARIIKLGRLEYEPMAYRWDTAYGNVSRDCPVLNIHIPSCGSLPIDAVIDSLQQAYRFFGGKGGECMPFICASWLLYPPMCEAVFPKGSNLYAFYRCFHIAEEYQDPENKHFWRIFGTPYTPAALEAAPTDTTLRRALRDWMLQGNHMGIGRGAFLFDGEKILCDPA